MEAFAAGGVVSLPAFGAAAALAGASGATVAAAGFATDCGTTASGCGSGVSDERCAQPVPSVNRRAAMQAKRMFGTFIGQAYPLR